MKLTDISLYTNGSEVARLSFRDPSSTNPYQVKAIDGLDSDTIIPKFYQNGGAGTNFHELSMPNRTIVLKVKLNPDFSLGSSFSDLRDNLYRAISSSRTGLVEIKFLNGASVMASISGFITKLAAPHFDKTATVEVTVECVGGMLIAPTSEAVSIPSGVSPITITDDISTAPHGFSFYILFTAPTTEFFMSSALWGFTVTPGTIDGDTGFLAGDQLYFVNEFSGKQLFIVRDGLSIHLADKIDPGSVWPIIFPSPSINEFVVPSSGITWLTFTYFNTYWGV